MLTSERASRAAFQTGEGRGLTAWGGSGAEGSGKEKGIGRSAGGAGGAGPGGRGGVCGRGRGAGRQAGPRGGACGANLLAALVRLVLSPKGGTAFGPTGLRHNVFYSFQRFPLLTSENSNASVWDLSTLFI